MTPKSVDSTTPRRISQPTRFPHVSRRMGPYAHSRCPSALFQCARPPTHAAYTAPLNEDAQYGHTGAQPVRYRNVTLRIPTSDDAYKAGDVLPVVDVDWLTGCMFVYMDEDDATSNIVAVETSFAMVCGGLSSETYADEIAALIRRGHSLTAPHCECKHALTPARASQLGIKPASHRVGNCSSAREPITPAMMSTEIAVFDHANYVDADGTRLQPLIERYVADMDRPQQRVRSPPELVLRLRDAWPLPVQMPDPMSSYAGIRRDSRRLHDDGTITMLPSAQDGEWSLFYVDSMGLSVDADVRELWRRAPA